MTDLVLEVRDGNITVWLPGSSYSVTYYKPRQISPQLLAKHIASSDDPRVAVTSSDFLAGSLAACQQQGARARLDRLAATAAAPQTSPAHLPPDRQEP